MYAGRILSWVKDVNADKLCLESSHADESGNLNSNPINKSRAKDGHVSSFLPTSRRIVQFSNGKVYFTPLLCLYYPAENVNKFIFKFGQISYSENLKSLRGYLYSLG